MSNSIETLIVSDDLAGERLDKLLSLSYPSYSRNYFQNLIDSNCVLVNGEKFKKREKPIEGDEIEICFQLTDEIDIKPQEIPLDILYEDEYIIAINKPAGMVVHPAPGHPDKTFVNALLHHVKTLPGSDTLRPGIVHRLDKNTTGVLIAAKTLEAHQKLIEMFSEKEMKKSYLAICIGSPKQTKVDLPIGRHPKKRQEMAICHEKGKEALTQIQVLHTSELFSCVKLFPLTGRTHQIRVHLKSLNTPILGDELYGNKHWNTKYGVTHQLLHAYRLQFNHPITKKNLNIIAPIPLEMDCWIEKIKK